VPIMGPNNIVSYRAENLKQYDLINLDLSIDKKIGNIRINTGFSPYITRNKINILDFKDTSQFSYYAFFNTYFTFKKDVTIDVTTSYVSKQRLGIYKLEPFYETGIGINKTFFKKKMDARLFISDIFNNFTYRSETIGLLGVFEKYRKQETRLVTFSINYKITSDKIKKSTYNLNSEKERF
jgi:hypothetical protein